MGKRILVLNVELSGINKYLFSHLQKRNWQLTVVDVPYPKVCKWWALISTFRPTIRLNNISIGEWKKRFNEKLGKLYKSPWTFRQRSKFCQKKIEKLNSDFDLIFQISGMFAPAFEFANLKRPYVTYNDYTMALSQKYPAWITPRSELNKWLRLEKELYGNASLLFTTNENARKSLIEDYGVEKKKTVTVGCGLNLDGTANFLKKYDGRTILFIGKDFTRKGGFVLLDAFRQVRKIIPQARLIIAGPNKDMLKIRQAGVQMLGYITDKEMIKDLYKQSSIFVMPSLCEPFGLVFLEAMAYKLPCIGTNIDAIDEIIEDAQTGFLVAPGESMTLADKVILLLQNTTLMQEMGEAGHLRVREKYTWDKVLDRIEPCLRQILNHQECKDE